MNDLAVLIAGTIIYLWSDRMLDQQNNITSDVTSTIYLIILLFGMFLFIFGTIGALTNGAAG